MVASGVYILFDKKSGYFYIGSSENMSKRVQRHFRDLKSRKHHNSRLQKIFDAGSDFLPIYQTVEEREDAYYIEQTIIDANKNNPLMVNIGSSVIGGDNMTRNPDRVSIIERIKDSVNKKMKSLSNDDRKTIWGRVGCLNGMYGKKHSQHSIDRMREKRMGNTHAKGSKRSFSQRQRLSDLAKERTGCKNPFYGRTHTNESRTLISEKLRAMQIVPTNRRRIVIDGVIYESVTTAAKTLNVSLATILYRISSHTDRYKGYTYLD